MKASPPSRPGGRWYHGWNIVAVTSLAQIAGNGLPIYAFSLFLLDWSAQLRAPISTFTLAIGLMGVVSSLVSPFFGTLADRKPARWLFGLGLLIIALFNLGMSFATQAWQVVVLYGVVFPIGYCASASPLTSNAVISRWFVRRMGLAVGLSASGLGMASVVLPPLVAALAPEIGWRMIWRGAGLIIAFVITPLVVLIVRDRPSDERDSLDYVRASDAPCAHDSSAAGADGPGWRDILARKNFWLLVAVYLPIVAIYGGTAHNLAPLAASRGFGPEAAGLLLSVIGLAHIASTLGLGLVSDRFGNRIPLVGLALSVATGALLLAFGRTFPALLAGAMFAGAGGGLFTLLAAALAVEFGPAGLGRSLGVALAFLPIISIAPFAIAKSQELTGSYAPSLIGLALAAVMGGALCLLLLRQRRILSAIAPEAATISA